MEESLRKKGGQRLGDGILHESMFQARIWKQVEGILYDLILKVGQKVHPLRSNNLQQLNLPLISDEYEKEDIMLATALALGDDDIVEKVTGLFPKQKLGIGLNKLSPICITRMIGVLESIDESSLDIDAIGVLVGLGIYDTDFREGKPSIAFLKEEMVRFPKRKFIGQLSDAARKCGLHVIEMSSLKPTVVGRGQGRGSENRRMRINLIKGRETGNWSVNGDHDDKVMITNFHSSFDVPVTMQEGGLGRPDFESIRLVGSAASGKRQKKTSKSGVNTTKPNEDEIANLFAKKIAARMAKIAAKRLKQLVANGNRSALQDDQEVVSLQHIAVSSGYDGELLKALEETDQTILSEHTDSIRSALCTTLKKVIPPPEGTEEDGNEEISDFIDGYLKLITYSYCEIPRLSGAPPSKFVPDFDVTNEALQGSCWSSKPMMVHSTRRLLVKNERERIIRSRKVVVLSRTYSVAFVGASWLLVSWLCFLASRAFLHYLRVYARFFIYPFVISQGFTLWTLTSLIKILRPIFHLDAKSVWEFVNCCVEFILRTYAAKCGLPTPYELEMTKQKRQVKERYIVWKMRIAKKAFYEALKRKRITDRECVLLLTDFAHSWVEKGSEEIVEGVLPVKLSEAEEFLKLRVENQDSCKEVTLSASDSLRNYLSTSKGTANDDTMSAIEGLYDLCSQINSYVQFAEGDRVVVNNEEDEAFPSNDLPQSSALVCRRNKTGSVVFTSATLCFVHFDGETSTTPTPVPIKCCQLSTQKETEDQDHSDEDEEDEDGASVVSTDKSSIRMEEEKDNEKDGIATPSKKKRARTVEEALVQGGWSLTRTKKHLKYSRRVKLSDGKSQKQTTTLSKTPSDWRAAKNALALLRRLDELFEDEDEEEDVATNSGVDCLLCASCSDRKPANCYSKNQLRKGDDRKCKQCIEFIVEA